MSDAVDRGITVTEMAPMDQAIPVLHETAAAFIGRALRGPLNQPVLVRSVGEYRRCFGDIWSRSSLGPAVHQFFEHGGRCLYVVRVANLARGSMLCLPASGSALILRALEPGSTECIRAAVDYDGIADADDRFNLTLQRIDPATGLVLDQELFDRLSHEESSTRFVADALLGSDLARVEQPFPMHRPEATNADRAPHDAGYVEATQQGTDGTELSDYDLVGSRRAETGLFALQQVDDFDLLYLPPPGKGRSAGPASILAAERYCRERNAMLIVDPPLEWQSAADAVAGCRAAGFVSPNMLGYFPRMQERGADTPVARAVGGALAGLMCKLDRHYGAWQSARQQGIRFNRQLQPAVGIDADDEGALIRCGLNVIQRGAAGAARLHGSTTLARGVESQFDLVSLPVRRLCLQIVSAIDAATRWAVFENDAAAIEARVRAQLHAYLGQLADLGAIDAGHIQVECRASADLHDARLDHGVTVEVVFQPAACSRPVSYTLHQGIAGCRVSRTAFAPA